MMVEIPIAFSDGPACSYRNPSVMRLTVILPIGLGAQFQITSDIGSEVCKDYAKYMVA